MNETQGVFTASGRAVAPVNVARVLRGAVMFNFGPRASAQRFMDADHIPDEVQTLFDLLDSRKLPYLLVGGLAMLTHVRGRNTEDVDLVLSVPDQRRLEPEVRIVEREEIAATGRLGGLRVDFLAAEVPLFAHVAAHHAEWRCFELPGGPRNLRCATPEGLMLLKLFALPPLYRQGRMDRVRLYEADLGGLLFLFPELNPERLLAALRPHLLASDVDELRKVLADLRPRPGRFGPPT